MPLIRPGEQTKTVLIRHPQLAQTLGLAFRYLWEQSEPLVVSEEKEKAIAARDTKKTASGEKAIHSKPRNVNPIRDGIHPDA
jgi:hypothetical protein